MYKACTYDIYGLLSSVIYGSNQIPRHSELIDRRNDLRSAKYFFPIIHFFEFLISRNSRNFKNLFFGDHCLVLYR